MLALFFLLHVFTVLLIADNGESVFLRGLCSFGVCSLTASLFVKLLERGVVFAIELRRTSEKIFRSEDGGGSRGE